MPRHLVFLLSVNAENMLKTFINQGVKIEFIPEKWYNFNMKGGHRIDEISEPSFP